MRLRGKDLFTAAIGAVAVVALTVVAVARSSGSDRPADESPFEGIPASALESFGVRFSGQGAEESARLAKDPGVLEAAVAEAAARKDPWAGQAPLRQPGILSIVDIQHRYGDGAPFSGPAWSFQFDAGLPASSRSGDRPPGRASLLVTVDARTGDLLAVNGFEPRQ